MNKLKKNIKKKCIFYIIYICNINVFTFTLEQIHAFLLNKIITYYKK